MSIQATSYHSQDIGAGSKVACLKRSFSEPALRSYLRTSAEERADVLAAIDRQKRYFVGRAVGHLSADALPQDFKKGCALAQQLMEKAFSADSVSLVHWKRWIDMKMQDPAFTKRFLIGTCIGNCIAMAKAILQHQNADNDPLPRPAIEKLKSRQEADLIFACSILQAWFTDINMMVIQNGCTSREQVSVYKEIRNVDVTSFAYQVRAMQFAHAHKEGQEFEHYSWTIEFLQRVVLKGDTSHLDSEYVLKSNHLSFTEILSNHFRSGKLPFSVGCMIFMAVRIGMGHAMMLYIDQINNHIILYDNNRGFYRFPSWQDAIVAIDDRYDNLYKITQNKAVYVAGVCKEDKRADAIRPLTAEGKSGYAWAMQSKAAGTKRT